MSPNPEIADAFRELSHVKLLPIILIAVAAWAAIKIADRLFPWVAERLPARFRLHVLPVVTIVRLMIFALAMVLIVPLIIEPSFQNLVAILAAAGLAIGFAFKDYMSGIIGGLLVVYERPYRVGDWVEIDGDYGEVKSVSARSVRLLTPDDTVVHIPHTRMWQSAIRNHNDGKRDLQCTADFYLDSDHDGSLMRQRLHDVALTSPYVNLDHPIIVVTSENPWGTRHRIRAYPIDAREQFLFISDLTARGRRSISEAGGRPIRVPWHPGKEDGVQGLSGTGP
ncbi:Transporter, MscS family [uncultured Desulfatiglans sp.]|nr:Transporter, MscS family [uncultured Desulfatiglans sp.]